MHTTLYVGLSVCLKSLWSQFFGFWELRGNQIWVTAPAQLPLPANAWQFCLLNGNTYKNIGMRYFGKKHRLEKISVASDLQRWIFTVTKKRNGSPDVKRSLTWKLLDIWKTRYWWMDIGQTDRDKASLRDACMCLGKPTTTWRYLRKIIPDANTKTLIIHGCLRQLTAGGM